MIHDLSHLADEAFEAVMAAARGPVVATHSNSRVITGEDQRHLRDDQVMAIAERDGIIGLNLFSMFLVPEGRATISDCVAHLQRITELMGHRRGVGLGSDMDGGFGPDSLPIGLDHPGKLGALAEALADTGWSEQDIQGFRSENWRRFLQRNLPR
jgi:membrane dipeptidase